MMQSWGAECVREPSELTQTGRAGLEKDPENQGSLGFSRSRRRGGSCGRGDTNYTLGSGAEPRAVAPGESSVCSRSEKQFDKIGLYPDVVFRAVRGRIVLVAGIDIPFLAKGGRRSAAQNLRCVAHGRAAVLPTMTRRSVCLYGRFGEMPRASHR